MNGMHDMGGMQTFGPVQIEDDGKVFHEPWEGRIFAISLILPAQGVYNLNEFRSRRERIPPPEYLRSSYFELWLASMEQLLVEKGVLGREELEARRARPESPASSPAPHDPGLAGRMLDIVHQGVEDVREGSPPRFQSGARVRARNAHPRGHTRLPRYVRGKRGTVELVHGCFDLPDASAEGRDVSQRLYTVRFVAQELWGPEARAGDAVRVDLWESYLEAEEGEG